VRQLSRAVWAAPGVGSVPKCADSRNVALLGCRRFCLVRWRISESVSYTAPPLQQCFAPASSDAEKARNNPNANGRQSAAVVWLPNNCKFLVPRLRVRRFPEQRPVLSTPVCPHGGFLGVRHTICALLGSVASLQFAATKSRRRCDNNRCALRPSPWCLAGRLLRETQLLRCRCAGRVVESSPAARAGAAERTAVLCLRGHSKVRRCR
jgi:hypothetical protein